MFRIMYVLCFFALVVIGCVQPSSSQVAESEIGGGGACGEAFCGKNQFCCNTGCVQVCVEIGGGCTQQACVTADEVADEVGVDVATLATEADPEDMAALGISACGPNFCTGGTVCCNSSCGICTAPGDKCTQQFCPPVE